LSRTLPAPVRILGLDPGLRRTGWGVVEAHGARLAWIAHGVCAPREDLPFAERLLFLFDGIGDVIAAHARTRRRSRRPSWPTTPARR
jgi:crossover junction endodeoxyribonuclease RuvC